LKAHPSDEQYILGAPADAILLQKLQTEPR
jgi:hypothetical protein